jgi:transcriptional regulator GlxA family with amidase domain
MPASLVFAAILLVAPSFCASSEAPSLDRPLHLKTPHAGKLKVAFVIAEGAVMIDFAGPWEVFQDVMVIPPGRSMHESAGPDMHVFELYTVSDSRSPVRVSGGAQIIPDYTFDDAPPPDVLVVPAVNASSQKMLAWIRQSASHGDVIMSVCTGAFTLAEAGLLDGKSATTHHDTWGMLQTQYPRIKVQTNRRYVQSSAYIFTSGGLSAGIDLALHIVEAYFGREVAQQTAINMEYEGAGWKGNGASTLKYKDGMAGMAMEHKSSNTN